MNAGRSRADRWVDYLKPIIAATLELATSHCRLPRAWDHRESVSATVMGPPGCQ